MGKAPVYIKSKLVNAGTIIEDIKKKQWVIGTVLGQGGFGAIYTAQEINSNAFNNVMKIEPSSNGPLYTEVNFYKRVCAEKEITSWMSERKMKFLGIPRYISDGLVGDNDRFLIMDRYGDDLHKILMKNSLSHKCLFQIAINILDVLEYIHSREYSHADIKALNILQGYKSPKEVFLLDFGMVTKFMHNGVHRPEKPDNKLKHNGTLEFCPRDSHRGLVSCRRSDVESLMFNLIFWLTWDKTRPDPSARVGFGKLPWLSFMKIIGDKSPSPAVLKQVADSKEKYMENPKLFIESVNLDNHSWSQYLVDVLNSVSSLQYTEVPKYDDIRKKFASIICMIDGKSVTPNLLSNLDSFRSIQWTTNTSANRRKSHMATQMTPPKSTGSAGRKRPSLNDDDTDIEVKKPKKRAERKKVLEVNNSSVDGRSTSKKKDQVISECDSNSLNSVIPTPEDFSNIIPKLAFLSSRTGPKNSPLAQKENSKAVKKTAVKARKPKLTDANAMLVVPSAVQQNDIIPGAKVLKSLKSNGLPTRSSPRIVQKNQRQNESSSVNIPRSVSCQTSPSLKA